MQQEPQEQRTENLALDLHDVRVSPWTRRIWRGPRWRPGKWRSGRIAASGHWQVVIFAVALLVVLAGGIAGGVLALRAPAATFQRVRLGNLAVTASGTGPVEGTIYDVSFPAPGRIAEIDAQVGQHVNKGQVLARLDTAALQDVVTQAQAQVDATTTTLNSALSAYSRTVDASQAVASAALAQEQNALYTCHHESAPPPDCQTQASDQYAATIAQAHANEATASAQVAVTRANLTQAQGQLHTAQVALTGAALTAPASGIVGAINGVVGGSSGTVAAGPSGMGPFMEIVDMSTVRLVAQVDAASIRRVAAGNPVAFTIDIYGKRVFHGTVSAVSPLGQVSSRTVTYPVTIQVDPASLGDVSLLSGLNAHITITTAQRYGVILVPAAALAFARANRNRIGGTLVSRAQIASALAQARQMAARVSAAAAAGPGVPSETPTAAYVLEQAQGGWVATPIVLGLTDGAHYEVLDGLQTGEVVAMTP